MPEDDALPALIHPDEHLVWLGATDDPGCAEFGVALFGRLVMTLPVNQLGIASGGDRYWLLSNRLEPSPLVRGELAGLLEDRLKMRKLREIGDSVGIAAPDL